MEAGTLKHFVNVEQLSTTYDDKGNPEKVWTAVYTNVPASVVNLSGIELVRAKQVAAEVTTKIAFWYLPNITTQHRISFQGLHFNILYIDNKEYKNFELELLTKATP